MKQEAQDVPQGAALVLDRWNSWVHLYFPETEETRWIDLATLPGYETLQKAEPQPSRLQPVR